jgi:hypothetical protein
MVFFKEPQLNIDEFKKKLLLAKDNYGYINWNQAAEKVSLGSLET